jgi:uncharacterized protein with von Willebrand factor type A (vWA) domain
MFEDFILALRGAGVPASLTEYLALLGAMNKGVAAYSVEDFYYLARSALVKDERHIDRFDRVFGEFFRGAQAPAGAELLRTLPEEWLRKLAEKLLTPEDMEQIAALGGFEALMETLRQRLEEQQARHQGGNKWIGTAGTSPFGAHGYNPEGVRIGQDTSRHRRAVKVWDKREFRDLDDRVELGTRGMKLALRRLRRFARQGALSELDLNDTVRATAAQAGLLDLRMVPERHNTVKLLLFLDVGGSMDEHVQLCEQLFSAARAEFKHLEHFYFHNCPYDRVWRNNRRRHEDTIATEQVLRTYGADYTLIFVGDASMSPYEITQAGGSVEHMNPEPGRVWLTRLAAQYRRCAWINPVGERHWDYAQSLRMIRDLLQHRMYPLTLQGLDDMARALSRGAA